MSLTVRRLGGWSLRAATTAAILLTVYPSNRLTAQMSFHVGLGARYSTMLVHDSIVTSIDLRPTIAPTLLLTARDELRGPWSADATVDVSVSGLRRHEGGGSFDAGSFTAIAFTVGMQRQVTPGVAARLGVGGLVYAAAETGVFRQGHGGVFPTAALAVTYAPPFAWAAQRGLQLEARYDVHRFITPALRSVTFNNPRPVHRIGLGVRARVFGGRAANEDQ